MYVNMTWRDNPLECDCVVLFVYELFGSELKSQDMECSMMFWEELKDIGVVCQYSTYFPCMLLAFHISSSYLQLCARMMLFREDIMSS